MGRTASYPHPQLLHLQEHKNGGDAHAKKIGGWHAEEDHVHRCDTENACEVWECEVERGEQNHLAQKFYDGSLQRLATRLEVASTDDLKRHKRAK